MTVKINLITHRPSSGRLIRIQQDRHYTHPFPRYPILYKADARMADLSIFSSETKNGAASWWIDEVILDVCFYFNISHSNSLYRVLFSIMKTHELVCIGFSAF